MARPLKTTLFLMDATDFQAPPARMSWRTTAGTALALA